MKYRREESFRYTFKTPLEGVFKILIVNNDNMKETSEAPIEVVDISPGGLCFTSSLDMPLENKEFLLEVHFSLADEPIVVLGKIVWKRHYANAYMYGFEAVEDEKTEQQIIDHLKMFIQENR
jgi:hypothetical protein